MKSLKKILLKFLFISTLAIIAFIFYNNNIQTNAENEHSSIALMNQSKMENYLNDRFQIQVLNGCGDKGIADLYASYLRDNSYDVIDYKNADHFNYNASQIIVHNNNLLVENIADLLFIPSSNIDYVFDENIFYDLTLIVGKDYKNLNSYNDVNKHHNPFK